MPTLVVGVDVSLLTLDVCLRPANHHLPIPDAYRLPLSYPNDPTGHQLLITQLRSLGNQPADIDVVLESTGGLEEEVMIALQAVDITAHRIDPHKIKNFSKAHGYRAKTDRLDAELLAEYGRRMTMESRPLPDQKTRQFRDLLDRRQQLIAMRTMEENRLRSTRDAQAKKSVEKLIRWLDAALKARIAANPIWKQTDAILQSVPGLGPVASMALIGYVPELGTLDRKQVSHLVGLAPLANDSGQSHGPRSIVGGRKQIRNILYMAALAGSRHHPGGSRLAARLHTKGKANKAILIAVAHKLLIVANSLVRQGVMYNADKALGDLRESPKTT